LNSIGHLPVFGVKVKLCFPKIKNPHQLYPMGVLMVDFFKSGYESSLRPWEWHTTTTPTTDKRERPLKEASFMVKPDKIMG